MFLPPEIHSLVDEYASAEGDARALLAGLHDDLGVWREHSSSWSVAECLEHLALTNAMYLGAMLPAAAKARTEQRLRRRPAQPGIVGSLFLRVIEPPVTPLRKISAPTKIRPVRQSLADAIAAFFREHGQATSFLRENADLDLADIPFANPFIPGARFSLATGVHIVVAHERRHLYQAWRSRRAGEAALAANYPLPKQKPHHQVAG